MRIDLPFLPWSFSAAATRRPAWRPRPRLGLRSALLLIALTALCMPYAVDTIRGEFYIYHSGQELHWDREAFRLMHSGASIDEVATALRRAESHARSAERFTTEEVAQRLRLVRRDRRAVVERLAKARGSPGLSNSPNPSPQRTPARRDDHAR